jgi:hypothetical protein
LIDAWAKWLTENFDPRQLGLVFVSQPNKQGLYHIIDGQHRCEVSRQLFGDDQQMLCQIMDADDPATCADMFDKLQTNRKAPSVLDKFQVRVTAERSKESAVNEIVEAAGYKVSNSPMPGNIRAAGSLVQAYTLYGDEPLLIALQVIKKTWTGDAEALDAVRGEFIVGYAEFLHKYDNVSLSRLIGVMAKAGTPGYLLGRAKSNKDALGGTLSNAICRLITLTYQKKLRGKKLNGQIAA